jgi:hypothetical protein
MTREETCGAIRLYCSEPLPRTTFCYSRHYTMLQRLAYVFSPSKSNDVYLSLPVDESMAAPSDVKLRTRRPVGFLIPMIFVVVGIIIGLLASFFFIHNSHTQNLYSNCESTHLSLNCYQATDWLLALVPLEIQDQVFSYNQSFGSGPIEVPESETFWSSIVPRKSSPSPGGDVYAWVLTLCRWERDGRVSSRQP